MIITAIEKRYYSILTIYDIVQLSRKIVAIYIILVRYEQFLLGNMYKRKRNKLEE